MGIRGSLALKAEPYVDLPSDGWRLESGVGLALGWGGEVRRAEKEAALYHCGEARRLRCLGGFTDVAAVELAWRM